MIKDNKFSCHSALDAEFIMILILLLMDPESSLSVGRQVQDDKGGTIV